MVPRRLGFAQQQHIRRDAREGVIETLDVSTLLPSAFTALVTFAGAWMAFSNRITRLETKIDGLSERVEKHNGVVERTYKLESDVATMWHRHDELRDDLHDVKEKI